ncbi:hypothetical protein CR513_45486, partial [Mucuna pruriens]
MLDQLHKTPACVSLLSLLINSEGHRDLLLKVLNDAHVAQDITLEKFEGIINNITASCHLSFSEDETPAEGRSHNQPLHIAVTCGNYMIVRVLIDNGSSLNVMPKAMLDKLYSTGSTLKISSVVVKAFDGSKPEVMGEITLPVRIGPTTFDITFQHPSSNGYIEGEEEALETSFQALEIVSTTSGEVEGGGPKLSKAVIMAAKVLISNGFQPDKGLGKGLDNIVEPVALLENPGRSRLGYTGAVKEKGPGRRALGKKWIQPNLYRHFMNGGIISMDQVTAIEDQPLELEEWVIPTSQELNNASESYGQDKGEDSEEETLKDQNSNPEPKNWKPLTSAKKEKQEIGVGE